MSTPAELHRRLDNLIRLGTIAELDHARSLCRVHTGQLLTDWRPWLELRAGTTRSWNPPSVGEQVALLSPSGELATAIVLTGLYTHAHPAPSPSANEHVTHYPDGARIAYNHATGHLHVSGMQSIRIECPDIELVGNVRHHGGTLASHGVVLHTHVHTRVEPGPGLSGEPAR